jgi:hypothetical protein
MKGKCVACGNETNKSVGQILYWCSKVCRKRGRRLRAKYLKQNA